MTLPSALRGLLVLAFLALAGPAAAQEAIPPLSARVTDLTGTLTRPQAAALEGKLAAFEAKKGSQIAVLMVPGTGGEPIEQYALRAAEQWKLGRKDVDDGALLVVAKDDRALRIEVGYGLEGALPDAIAKRIIAEAIVPHFRQGDFYGGIAAGVERIIAVAEGEPLPAPRPAGRGAAGIGEYLPVLFIVALFAGGLLRALLGRFLGAAATGGIAAWIGWAFAGALSVALLAGIGVFLFTLLSGFGRRGIGGPGWGGGLGGLGGLSGGGGFGGGGGGFGGGGASGRW